MFIILFGAFVLLFLTLVFPLLDVRFVKPVKEKDDPASRVGYFKFVIISEWTVTALILLTVLTASVTFRDLGLTRPSENVSQFMGMITGFLVGVALLVFVLMRLPVYQRMLARQTDGITYLIPDTKWDRSWSVAAAVTAGICEEIIYRGFVIHYLEILPFGLSTAAILLLSSLIFGFAHVYQGWKGVLLTGLIGFVLARAYLATGSLLFPIILHIIIDLRSFLFTKKQPSAVQEAVS